MNKTRMLRCRALLASARVANVPSVVSNVWVGVVIGQLCQPEWAGRGVNAPDARVWWLAMAGVCLYVAGNFLNDWFDRDWDRKHRPERALPSGMFCPSTYGSMALGLVVMAAICAWAVSWQAVCVAGIIVLCVLLYTWIHKRSGWGVVWVGLCRALLVVLGASAVLSPAEKTGWQGHPLMLAGVAAIPLFCYVVGLSVSARFEARKGPPAWVPVVSASLLALPLLLGGAATGFYEGFSRAAPAGLPYVLWMIWCHRSRKNLPCYVSRLLAGIPLVDLMMLLPFALALGLQGIPSSPLVYVLPLAAFGIGLILQRIAPAS